MVMQFEYPRNALLDLSPINDAIDFRAKQQQRAKDNAYRDEQLGMQKEEFGLKKQGMEDARQKAFVQKAAGIAQMISQEKDPAVASARWGQLVNSDPRWGNALKASGVDPNDFRTGPQMIIAEARGYQDELDVDLKKAQIAKLQREAASGDNPAAVREWKFYSNLPPEQRQQYITMKRADQWKDIGTGFVMPNVVNPSGAPVATLQKDVAGAAAQKEIGERQGQAAADLPRQEDNAALALDTINQIRSHPGKQYGLGVAGVLPGIPGTQQKGFVSLVEQAKGKTFLEAFNSLKGGGQITEAEGRKATEALARLDRAQRPEDFDKALSDLETVIQLGLQRSRKATGGRTTTGGQGTPQPGTIMDGYRFKGGNPADPNSWERAK